MLAIYSNNYLTDLVISHCNFSCPNEIFRSIDQYVNSDATVKLAFVNHLDQFHVFESEHARSEAIKNGTKFSQDIQQLQSCSQAVFAFDNEFHAYHCDIFKANCQSNIHWVIPIHSTPLTDNTQMNILPWNVQFMYQVSSYRKALLHKLDEIQQGVKKSFYFDALLGLTRSFREFVFHAVINSKHQEKIFLTYGKLAQEEQTFKYQWEPEVEFLRPFHSSADYVNYLGENIKLSLIVPITLYNKCAYSIITETNAFNDYSFFTEKIARPLLAKRLFVVFSGYNYLKNLRKLGFQTFGNVIDESYDDIIDDQQRWAEAFQQVERLCDMEQTSVYQQIQPILEHNYQLFTTTDWNQLMIDQIKHVVNNLLH